MGLEGHGQLPMSCPWLVRLRQIGTYLARDSPYFTRQQLEETTQYETRAARPTPRLLPT
jgi:hypothetical protein